MERYIASDLKAWKESPDRRPLILKGVPQCGKTHAAMDFGIGNYIDLAYFDVPEHPELEDSFESDVDDMLREMSLINGTPPGNGTLLVLDHVEHCDGIWDAVSRLHHGHPGIHIMCVTSRGGPKDDDGFDTIVMRPICFGEFVLACG